MVAVIAEAGVNHNGDIGRALDLIAAAAQAGANIVKFQAFSSNELVASAAATADYQRAQTGFANQAALLKSVELAPSDLAKLSRASIDIGVEFLCTAFDIATLRRLIAEGMRRIKIPSGELTNIPMLRKIATFNLPVVLSTGMATLEEVRRSVGVLREEGTADLTILHCTSLYPAPDEAINLRAITTMQKVFGLPVGYSDHSCGDHVSIAAVALGATMIEKHLTQDRNLPGPDHKTSLEPGEFSVMVKRIRAVERALGDGDKRPAAGESDVAKLVRRSWHTARRLAKGAVIGKGDVVLKRPADGLAPESNPVGRKLLRARAADEPIRMDDLA